jgi:hypothetical protein
MGPFVETKRHARLGDGMDGRAVWIARNGAFAVALYLAMVGQVGWMMYGIALVSWLALAVNAWTITDPLPVAAGGASASPPLTTIVFDAAVLVSMFAAHWYWTAFAYSLSCAFAALAHARAASRP